MSGVEGALGVQLAGRDRTVRLAVHALVVLSALAILGLGGWMWGWPDNFAAYVNFPNHVHFLHDMGVYHLGVALGLLLALVKRDAIFVVMVAFAAINVLHAFNHVLDRDLGGHPSDPYVIGVQALLAGAGAVLRAYQLRAQQRRADEREAAHR